MASEPEDTDCEECRDDEGRLVSYPEEAQSDWQFSARVEVAEKQDDIRNEAALNYTQ